MPVRMPDEAGHAHAWGMTRASAVAVLHQPWKAPSALTRAHSLTRRAPTEHLLHAGRRAGARWCLRRTGLPGERRQARDSQTETQAGPPLGGWGPNPAGLGLGAQAGRKENPNARCGPAPGLRWPGRRNLAPLARCAPLRERSGGCEALGPRRSSDRGASGRGCGRAAGAGAPPPACVSLATAASVWGSAPPPLRPGCGCEASGTASFLRILVPKPRPAAAVRWRPRKPFRVSPWGAGQGV